MALEYIHTGECIWCKKKKPNASFFTAPHIVPQSLGATEIGVDVCDDCNHFFGTASKGIPNTNLIFKEVFQASQCSLGERPKVKTKYSSAYFFYDRTTDRIKLKKIFPVAVITKQFKRSLYEAFLQKYHSTYPDESLDRFEAVRKFARYGEGELHVYYIHNKIILHSTDKIEDVTLHMSEVLKNDIAETGYYPFIFVGQILFLEVLPFTASIGGFNALWKVVEPLMLNIDGTNNIYELTDIRHFDMFYNRLARKIINSDNFLRP